MKILITGAHFTPAQAVIEQLKNYPDVKIVYVGRNTTREGDKTLSVESQVLPNLGVKFYPIIAGRFSRYLSFGSILSLFKIPIGFVQSFYILLKEQPDVILSFGGYTSVPVVICGWILSIPIITHQQTLVSGLANTISSIFANKIALTFDQKLKTEKMVLTGNPIRGKILEEPKNVSQDLEKIFKLSKKDKLPLIYITGGNQGAHIINQTVENILDDLTKSGLVIHQTGDSKFKDFERLEETKNGLKNPDRYLIKKWFDEEDVANIFRHASLVISRAGANTLLELAYFQIPTIVVPIPYLYKDEQNINAKFFEELGLCQVIKQKDLTDEKLLKKVKEIIKSIKNYQIKAQEAKKMVVSDAASNLAQMVMVEGSENV